MIRVDVQRNATVCCMVDLNLGGSTPPVLSQNDRGDL